jgi:hypothetical protein
MSFFTDLIFYRPRPAPVVTGDDLARFTSRLWDTGTLTARGLRLLKVKFGSSVDQDDRPTEWYEEEPSGIVIPHEIEWDIDVPNPPDVAGIIRALSGDERRIYRALVMLGQPTDGLLDPITREASPENEIGFHPDTLSVELGPIEICNLASDQPIHCGCIGVAVSGNGYLFPWTLRDVISRLETSSEAQRICEACRSEWPVQPDPPEKRIRALRRRFPDLWPYDNVDKPWDWYWGVAESG